MTETQQQPGKAIAHRQQPAVALGKPMFDLDQAYRLSQALALSDIIPDALKGKPGNVLALMLYGQDLGLSPMQAMQGIDVIKGKPRISAKLMVAKAREHGHRVTVTDQSDTSCTVEVVRRDTGERHEVTFTTDDAVTARACTIKDGKPYARSQRGEAMPWETRHRTMLQWRAASECLNFICPEIAFGFAVAGDVQVGEDGFETQVAEVEPDKPSEDIAADFDDVEDAEIVDTEQTAAEVAGLAEQFDFTPKTNEPEPAEAPPDADEGNPLIYTDREIAEAVGDA
jgi:hypothetical protein